MTNYPCTVQGCNYRAQNPKALAFHVKRKHPEELRPIVPIRQPSGDVVLQPRRAALYLRVSTVDQHPENQMPKLKTYAEAMGFEVVAIYEEKASGRNMDRPMLKQLQTDALAGNFDVVLFTRISRLGRSLRDNVTLFDFFHGLNIALVASEEPWDTRSPAGRFARNILACAAEFEREQRLEQIREGIARRRAEGRYLGRHPAGCGLRFACPEGYDHNDPREVLKRYVAAGKEDRAAKLRKRVGKVAPEKGGSPQTPTFPSEKVGGGEGP